MRWMPLFVLLGCPGPPTETDTDTTPPDSDTDSPYGGEEGSLALLRTYENGTLVHAEVVGIFTNDDQGFLNMAQCARSDETPCLRALPDPGTRIPYDPTDRFVTSSSFYRYVGLSLDYGPYRAFYVVEDDLSLYYADVTDDGDYHGPADIELDVQWGPYEGVDVASIAPPLVVTEPVYDEDEAIQVFSDDTDFRFTWEPGDGTGQMYLVVREADPLLDGWVYAIEDDGEYALDVSALGLIGNHDLAFQLTRWTLETVDVNGNTLRAQSTADNTFFVRYIDVQQREPIPIELAESCDEAFPGRMPDGRFYGDLSNYSNDYQEAACLQSFDAANGRDGIAYLDLPPRTELRVSYRQLNSNAAMYLYDSCDDEPPVCVVGADLDIGQGVETLTRFNASETETEDFVLVLDADEPLSGGLFFVDVTRTPIPEPGLGDTCIDVLQMPNLQPGTYYQGDWNGYFDEVDPGVTGCTSTSLGGPDGLAPVLVPDNVTLEVTLSMPGGDPALYLLGQCTNENTCLDGSDVPGSIETLIYTNDTGAAQQLTLAVDNRGTPNPFTMTIRMF